MSERPLRVGLAGLGAVAKQILPAFSSVDGVELGAVADIRADVAEAQGSRLGVSWFTDVRAMCSDGDIDAIWVATPNWLHAEHTMLAAEHGKHVICEKPMAVDLEQARDMVAACSDNGVRYVQGHSKIFEAPVRTMRSLIASGELGALIQLHTLNFNDWLLRPRLAAEVDPDRGGGVVYRQGPHQVDIVRCLGGGMARSVRAVAGRHMPGFDVEGDLTALLLFDDGVPASIVFNGYGRFEAAELTWNITEGGRRLPAPSERQPRPVPAGPVSPDEKYAASPVQLLSHGEQPQRRQPFFGFTLASCERGDIRQSPEGVYVYTAEGLREVPCLSDHGRAGELGELVEALRVERPTFPDAAWGMASLEVVLAMLESSRTGREVELHHQSPMAVDWIEPTSLSSAVGA